MANNLLLALLLCPCSVPLCRTLDLYTSAVLEAVCDPPSGPAPEWRDMMKQLSKDSCEVRGACRVGRGGCDLAGDTSAAMSATTVGTGPCCSPRGRSQMPQSQPQGVPCTPCSLATTTSSTVLPPAPLTVPALAYSCAVLLLYAHTRRCTARTCSSVPPSSNTSTWQHQWGSWAGST